MGFLPEHIVQLATQTAQSSFLSCVHLSDNGILEQGPEFKETLNDIFGLNGQSHKEVFEINPRIPKANQERLHNLVKEYTRMDED
mmetsp:Transcript_38820/g.59017  ORF Transcript_38820/g.59017 Transcript_38820/m.59017 type:complete len:85 (+) Transcript_38820:104-358(+)